MWIIIQTKSSKRWSKVYKTKKAKKAKKTKKTKNHENNQTKKAKKNTISVDKLRQLLKKYNVTTRGSKEKMAQGLFRLSSSTIESNDLELIYNLLDEGQKKKQQNS
jgi:tRNA C32,U32 (ribose-2'-O)-methylase TrmJ